jgi:hypothetical protein
MTELGVVLTLILTDISNALTILINHLMMQILIKYANFVLTTTTGHRVRYHLYLQFQEFCQRNQIVDYTTTAARLSLPR